MLGGETAPKPQRNENAARLVARPASKWHQEVRVIDYVEIDEWSPWFAPAVSSIAPDGLLEGLRAASPEFLEDARDYMVRAVGREQLVMHLNRELAPYAFRVFHGTRVNQTELLRIRAEGLRPLNLADRRQSLTAMFSQHPEWSLEKARLLDAQLHRFGPGWERAGVGRREDDSVHVCLSRAGLLLGCNHYLTHGAEVDQNIAQAVFSDGSGMDLLRRNRAAKIVIFTAPFAEAAQAANPYGVPSHELPGLLSKLLAAWAYKMAKPSFSVAKLRDGCALKFKGPIPAERLETIESIHDANFNLG